MTPGDLYERCVALGLCERARWNGDPLSYRKGLWEVEGYDQIDVISKHDECASDLATMTVLRALEKRGLLSTYARVHKLDLKLLADFLIRHAETD